MLFNCESKVQVLQVEVEELKDKRRRLQEDVDEASRSEGEIYQNATRWLRDADKTIEEAEEFIQNNDEATKTCLFGFCPNWKTRYELNKKAEERALAIIQLYYDTRQDFISWSPPLQQIVEASNHSSELLPSRVLMLNQIMHALKDPSLNMIGIYGTGGVGKTTLAKRVCARARDEELFDDVIMIDVSRFPNLRRIQEEIAAFLGFKLDSEEVLGRANQLNQRLKKAKLLIILDDVWQKLDFQAVGIPFGDEGQGCKLLVSSRSKDVLSSGMGSLKNFYVDVLSPEESWNLFETIAPEVQDPRLSAVASKIAKRCAGLPLLIMLASLQLKNKALNAWVDMLKHLSEFKNEDLLERVSKVVESSFENLPGEKWKSLFLLCASYEQSNIQIQHLLIHGMGLHLFGNITTIEEARSAMYIMIRRLEEDGLLQDADLDGLVKMHDVVRDAANSIASRYHNSFNGASETSLIDFPNKDCVPIFSIQDFHANLRCPEAELELFLLSGDDLCLAFPDLCFDGISRLKVLGFTGVHFATRLPSSLGCLRNLRTMCFNRCKLDNVYVIGKMTHLQFLSFAGSEIFELPREIEALTLLKMLDLTNCSKLQVIPKNVISKLSLLEELHMRNTCVRWDEEGNASLLELVKLSCLSSLEMQIVNPKPISKLCSFFDGLRCCKIIMGKEQGWWESYETSRMLKIIKLDVSIHLNDAFKVLLGGMEDLYLDEVRGMGNALDDLILEGFLQLRHLWIKGDYGIRHLVKSIEGTSCNAFPLLESLRLDDLNSLEIICNGPQNLAFRELRILKVCSCGKLKSLFSFSSARCLLELQEIEVESCENIEAIISGGREDIEFTRLRSLKLKNLPHLKGVCNEEEVTEETELLFNGKVTFPNLMVLEVTKCRSLKYVFTEPNAKMLVQLKRLEIDNCELVEEIILCDEIERAEGDGIDKMVFPKLNFVLLKKLKNLKRFSCGFSVEFPSLTKLSIHKCPAMLYFATETSKKNASSKVDGNLLGENVRWHTLDRKMFPRLMNLHLRNGHSFQHTFNLNNINSLKSLYFDGRSLNASNCKNLKYLFMFSSAKCHTQHLDMEVRACQDMEAIAIASGRSEDLILELTQLRSLKLENLPRLSCFFDRKGGTGQTERMVSFPNITILVVDRCDSLKYLFTASMVKCLMQLKTLQISNCESVEAIIQSNLLQENEEIVCRIVFHKLDSLLLCGLPNMKVFGSGYEIEFPLLRELSVECRAMENFVPKYSDRNKTYIGDEYLFNELVTFSNLESMTITNMDTFRYLWHGKFISDGLFLKLKSLSVAKCSRLSVVFPPHALRKSQNLETQGITCFEDTSLQQMEMLQEVVDFPQLQSLKLKNLPRLTGFCDEQEQGFGVKVSFPSLKVLELCECKSFKYVFTTPVVNSLELLEMLEINNCELVEEILLSRQFDEVESIEKIVFPKLKYLSLEKLLDLKTFGFGYQVEFQSLKELSISYCPVLKNFVSKYSGEEPDNCLFNEMVTFSNLECMKVSHTHSFEHLWDGKFTTADSFLKLKSLRIEYCSKLSVVFPSNNYGRFQELETLYLCCCSRVEEIYQFEGKSSTGLNTSAAFSLQDLEIWNLPSLKYIWTTDPPEASTFEYLRSVKVFYCQDLKFVFPKSIARRLLQLQHLKIANSHMDAIIANSDFKESSFLVPRLTVLQLENLYQMRNLYKGLHALKCPKLKQLDIYGSNQEMNFRSEVRYPKLLGLDLVMKLGSKVSAYQKEKLPSFLKKKLFRSLEELTLDDQGLMLILGVESGVIFSKLKKVTLRSLEEESIPLLVGFLRRGSLEELVIVESYLEEIFWLDVGEKFPNHLRLKHLEVVSDDNVKHILKEDLQFNRLLDKLLTLNVEFCESLINIAPSSASFRNLASLHISVCSKMRNLVTVSTACTMKNLIVLRVSECYMMEDIVEDDELFGLLITFSKLKDLELYDLPTLNSFSSSNHDFDFPSLDRVSVKKCFAMKNFCGGQVLTPKLRAIHLQDEKLWKGDLNATIASQVKSRVTDSHSWQDK